jgi:hypothetical protein
MFRENRRKAIWKLPELQLAIEMTNEATYACLFLKEAQHLL